MKVDLFLMNFQMRWQALDEILLYISFIHTCIHVRVSLARYGTDHKKHQA